MKFLMREHITLLQKSRYKWAMVSKLSCYSFDVTKKEMIFASSTEEDIINSYNECSFQD